MKNPPFVIERTYHAPIAKVWRAITDTNDMRHWSFDLAEFKPEVGFEFQFLAGEDEKKYLHRCKVTEGIVGKKITYSWRYDGYEGLSHVTFELFAESENTRLKLTHAGLETFPLNPDFAKERFAEGWTYIMDKALMEFIETSKK